MYQMKLCWIGMSQYVLSLSNNMFSKKDWISKDLQQASVS